MAPEESAIVIGALRRIGERGVGGVDLHELVGGGVLPVDRRNVGVANPSQPTVRHLDLLTRGGRRYAENLVERGSRHESARVAVVQVRRRGAALLLLPLRRRGAAG